LYRPKLLEISVYYRTECRKGCRQIGNQQSDLEPVQTILTGQDTTKPSTTGQQQLLLRYRTQLLSLKR